MSDSLGEAVLDLRADVDHLKSDLAAAKSEAGKTQSNFEQSAKDIAKGIAGGLAIVATALVAINKGLEATVGEYVKYANQVRTLNQINGDTAENNSRLIQTLDDYKVKVEDIVTAQRKLATQHQTMDIPTLAKLSDEYLKLNDGAERQTFLTENFGRASAAWAEVMSQGSQAILERSAAVEESLILNKAALDQSRRYELALDAVNDKVYAAKIALGEHLLPVLIRLLDKTNAAIWGWGELLKWLGSTAPAAEFAAGMIKYLTLNLIDLQSEETKNTEASAKRSAQIQALILDTAHYQAELGRLRGEGKVGSEEWQNYTNAVNENNIALADLQAQQAAAATSTGDLTLKQQEAAAAADVLSQHYSDLFSIVGNLQGISDNYTKTTGDLKDKEKDLETQLAEAIEQGWKPTGEHVQAIRDKLTDVRTALADAATAFEMESKRAVLAMMFQKAGADGWQEGEMEALLNVGVQWRVYSQTVVDQSVKIQDALDQLDPTNAGLVAEYAQFMLDNPNVEITFDVFVRVHGNLPNYLTSQVERVQPGAVNMPPVKAIEQAEGGDWLVNVPTLFLAGDDGPERATFTPVGKPAPASGGATYNIYVAGSSQMNENDILRALQRRELLNGN